MPLMLRTNATMQYWIKTIRFGHNCPQRAGWSGETLQSVILIIDWCWGQRQRWKCLNWRMRLC